MTVLSRSSGLFGPPRFQYVMPRAVQHVAGHGEIDLLVEGQTCFLSGGESWDILIHYFEIWDSGF